MQRFINQHQHHQPTNTANGQEFVDPKNSSIKSNRIDVPSPITNFHHSNNYTPFTSIAGRSCNSRMSFYAALSSSWALLPLMISTLTLTPLILQCGCCRKKKRRVQKKRPPPAAGPQPTPLPPQGAAPMSPNQQMMMLSQPGMTQMHMLPAAAPGTPTFVLMQPPAQPQQMAFSQQQPPPPSAPPTPQAPPSTTSNPPQQPPKAASPTTQPQQPAQASPKKDGGQQQAEGQYEDIELSKDSNKGSSRRAGAGMDKPEEIKDQQKREGMADPGSYQTLADLNPDDVFVPNAK